MIIPAELAADLDRGNLAHLATVWLRNYAQFLRLPKTRPISPDEIVSDPYEALLSFQSALYTSHDAVLNEYLAIMAARPADASSNSEQLRRDLKKGIEWHLADASENIREGIPFYKCDLAYTPVTALSEFDAELASSMGKNPGDYMQILGLSSEVMHLVMHRDLKKCDSGLGEFADALSCIYSDSGDIRILKGTTTFDTKGAECHKYDELIDYSCGIADLYEEYARRNQGISEYAKFISGPGAAPERTDEVARVYKDIFQLSGCGQGALLFRAVHKIAGGSRDGVFNYGGMILRDPHILDVSEALERLPLTAGEKLHYQNVIRQAEAIRKRDMQPA